MFKIGQKVVCIDSSSRSELVKGNVYTIQDIVVCPKCNHIGIVIECSKLLPTYRCSCAKCNKNYNAHTLFQSYRSTRFSNVEYNFILAKDILSEQVEEKSDLPLPVFVPF